MSVTTVTGVKREARSNSANRPQTAEEKELEEWARRLANKPITQIGNPGQQQSTLNSYLGLNSGNSINDAGNSIPQNNGFDVESAIGRFTWHTFGEDKYIPCIFRNKEMYCCIRMVEISVIRELLNVLPTELYDCANLSSHHATSVEARLLSHINSWHCDGFYGPEPFSPNDLVVSLKDLEIFYDYLRFAYEVLSTGGQNPSNDFTKCGFVRVNNDNLIPFTVLTNGEKGVPLFYFEGQTDILKEKACPLSGWELAYLKVCCKVQGVRKDLISGSTLQIVKVSDLKAYFPKRTIFTENCWPVPKTKSLLPKPTVSGTTFITSSQISSDRWTRSIPYKNAINSNAISVTSTNVTTTSTASNVKNVSNSATVISNKIVGGRENGTKQTNNNVLTTQNPYAKGKDQEALSPEILAKMKVGAPPLDMSRLVNIPEELNCRVEGAYCVRMIIVEKQKMMHCINFKPFKSESYMLVLYEFMNYFFPSVSIYPTAVSVLRSCGVTTYLPNGSQIRTLNAHGFRIEHHWEMPLVQAIEVTQVMDKLRTFFRPRNAATNVINSAKTVSNGYTAMSSTNNYYKR